MISEIFPSRALADEDIDLVRKLYKGNELLIDIKRDTSALPGISAIKVGIDTMNAKFDSLNENFSSFVVEQRDHNKRMDDHNMRLEKILEKLAER